MKKSLLTAFLSLAFLASQAQIKPKQEDRFFYDFTYDFMLDAPTDVSQEFVPNGHTIGVMVDRAFGSGNFALAYGLDYSSQRYYSNLWVTTDLGSGDENFLVLGADSIERNRLSTDYIDGLFELRFRGTPNAKGRFFRFYLGAKGGVRVRSNSRLRTNKGIVRFDNLGFLNRFRYGAYTRIGYGLLNVYAYYSLSELFTEGALGDGTSVENITPMSIGISLML